MSDMREQTVFIVDDDAAVCDSIKELVESVGLRAESFASGQAFLDHYQPEHSGCLVLDVRMAEMSGLLLQEKLNALGASIPVIIITGHADVPMAVHALKAGAVDFVQKPYRNQLLLDSINNALTMDTIARRSLDESQNHDRQLATLTNREQEVLDKLLAGSISKQIAKELGISHRTVEAHRQSLLRKLGVGSVKELMLHPIAREKGE
jgi:two-component system, LuxR family, response regulator FixJ